MGVCLNADETIYHHAFVVPRFHIIGTFIFKCNVGFQLSHSLPYTVKPTSLFWLHIDKRRWKWIGEYVVETNFGFIDTSSPSYSPRSTLESGVENRTVFVKDKLCSLGRVQSNE